MANVPGNAHMRLYDGTITGGRAYAQQNSAARNIATIPFKPWLSSE